MAWYHMIFGAIEIARGRAVLKAIGDLVLIFLDPDECLVRNDSQIGNP